MSEKETSKKTSEAKKKTGFYTALYSCVGVMLILAAVIGYNNLSPDSRSSNDMGITSEISQQNALDKFEDATVVDVRQEQAAGYLTPDDRENQANNGSSLDNGTGRKEPSNPPAATATAQATATPSTVPKQTPVATAAPTKNAPAQTTAPAIQSQTPTQGSTPSQNPTQGKEPVSLEESENTVIIVPQNDETLENGNGQVSQDAIGASGQDNGQAVQDTVEASGSDNGQISQGEAEYSNEQENVAINGQPSMEGGILYPSDGSDGMVQANEGETEPRMFISFSDSDKMAWPLLGDVVMDYSRDHVIYDKTLDQYRTNETLCIAGEYGAPVRAATAGRVTDIYNSRETGKTVVIDHGNGWVTTYSQLQDDVSVMVGDVVESGQVFATIGEPSIYAVLLGYHLGFNVSKDNSPLNPNEVLASR